MNKYCVIGSPIEHSLSPKMHNAWFQDLDIKGSYTKEDITPEGLQDKIHYLKDNYDGFNVTYPLKDKILPYIDEIHPMAQDIGGVNTIKKVGLKWIGYNTDVLGMKAILEKSSSDHYFVMGSGNMAKTALIALKGKKTTIVCRDLNKGIKLISRSDNTAVIDFKEFKSLHVKNKVIINTLPLDIKIEGYLKGKEDNTFLDSNYNRNTTYGMKIYISGLELLILQGLESFHIWTGVRPPKEIAYKVLGVR